VKLVFPVPPAASATAKYYVYRRVTSPDRTIAYEVIDEAEVQGSGTSAHVVTASWPFPGYISVVPLDTFICAYLDDPQFPFSYTQGAITGKVLGSSYQPGSTTPVTVEIPGAHVYTNKPGVVSQANRASVFAISQADGRYTLWDSKFKGGTIVVYADNIPQNYLPPNATQPFQTVAFEIQSSESLYTAFVHSLLRLYLNIAVGDITVPPPPPPQPSSDFSIAILRDNNGTRTATSGIASIGASLVIGISPTSGGARESR